MKSFYLKNRKKNNLLRLLGTFTAITFLLNSIAFSAPAGTVSAYQPSTTNILSNNEEIQNLFIPENYGSIVKRWDTEGKDKSIILIQDAHCHYEAQHNISRILEVLVRDYGIDLVAVEGAEGDLDLSPYGKFENQRAKEKAVDTYASQGLLYPRYVLPCV